MSPCSASHCSAVRTQCHYIGCRHELRNRLDRRYKTRDDIKKKLKTEESDIHFLKRQIDRECDPLAWQTSLMLHARKAYDDQMSMKTRNRGNECTECAIASKDDEIALLKKKAEAAKSFAGFLREFPRVPSPTGATPGRGHDDLQPQPHLVHGVFILGSAQVAAYLAQGFQVERMRNS